MTEFGRITEVDVTRGTVFERQQVVDLSAVPPLEVVNLFDELTRPRNDAGEPDILLHGSYGVWPELRPSLANDLYLQSGCENAMYLTSAFGAALRYAIFNKRLARAIIAHDADSCSGITHMLSPRRDRTEFAFDPIFHQNIQRALKAGRRPDILRDGFVFAIDGDLCRRVPEDPHGVNWLCYERAIQPRRIYRVSWSVGKVLFGNTDSRFSMRALTRKEMGMFRMHLEQDRKGAATTVMDRPTFEAWRNQLLPLELQALARTA